MTDLRLDLRPLFPAERGALLRLLGTLGRDDWATPTALATWTVHDIAAHLLADDFGRLSAGRDGHHSPNFADGFDVATFEGLVGAIDRQNDEWVRATRRLSPRLLTNLLRLSGDATAAYFAQLDLDRLGSSVDWAGPDPAPVWLDLAREYTERWVHQQHIRDALDRPGLKEPHWLAPVLATFAHALPRALRECSAPAGTTVRFVVTGPAGGTWSVRREPLGWRLSTEAATALASVTLDQETAWRLFTRGIDRAEARQRANLTGRPDLGEALLGSLAILA